jgi:hypothetical protein
MSQLVDRYLFAVGAQLPARQRDDIIAELRDVLMNRAEERQEALGRPMNREEEDAMLKAFGHPLVVAGGYQRFQHLIGPTVYPFYVFTLKVVLGVMLEVWMAIVILDIIGMRGAVLERLDDSILSSLVLAFGVVTLVMAAIERSGGAQQMIARWNPRTLPPVVRKAGNRRFESAFELTFGAGFVLWWLGVVHFPVLRFPAPGGSVVFGLAPVWHAFFWPVLALSVLSIALGLFELIRADLARTGAGLRIAYRVATLALVGVLARAGELLTVTATGGVDAATIEGFSRQAGVISTFVLWGIATCAVYEISRAGWRIWRLGPQT